MKKQWPVDTPQYFLSWVKVRSLEDGECWTWRLSMTDNIYPQGTYMGKHVNVRRKLLDESRGPAPRMIAWCSCGNSACVNPAHLVWKTRASRLKGIVKSTVHCVKLAEAARKRSGLTLEKVAAIRSDGRSNVELAAEFGVGDTVVSAVRHHKVWKDYASPFAGLMNSNG